MPSTKNLFIKIKPKIDEVVKQIIGTRTLSSDDAMIESRSILKDQWLSFNKLKTLAAIHLLKSFTKEDPCLELVKSTLTNGEEPLLSVDDFTKLLSDLKHLGLIVATVGNRLIINLNEQPKKE